MDTVRVMAPDDGAPVPRFQHKIRAVIAVTMPPGTMGTHGRRLSFVDPAGNPLPGGAKTRSRSPAPKMDGSRILKWCWTCWSRAGIYRLVVEVDGAEVGHIPLKLQIARTKNAPIVGRGSVTGH
jgi:hypothetical protein